MPWSNSWSGGNAVIASSVQVVNGQAVVASITPNGDITGKSLSVTGDIQLNGSSLTTTLSEIPIGVIAQTTVPAAHLPTGSFGATESGLFELDVILSAGRQYMLSLLNMVANPTGALCRIAVWIRFTTDGTTPTTASNGLFEVWTPVESADGLFNILPDHSIVFSVSTQTQLRMLVTSANQILTGGVQQSHKFIAAGTGVGNEGPMLQVADQGPIVPDTGIFIGGQTAIFRSFSTICTDSQSFQGSGAASPGSGNSNQQFMYFGQDPSFTANGVWRSYAWFNLASTSGGNGLGSIGNMSGAVAGNVSYLDVWILTSWWYQVAGGTLFVGHTNATATHSTEPASHTYQEQFKGYTARGQGQWISLLGSGIETAILNGTFQGIVLGPNPSAGVAGYGYAAGQGFGSNQPAIRAGYYK